MQNNEGLLSGLFTILSAGLISVLVTTFFAILGSKLLELYMRNFGRKISKDVERDSLESWELRDS